MARMAVGKEAMGQRWMWLMAALLGLAWLLRVPLLHGPRFHPDEALFASFARSIAVWRDPLLRTVPVDKPPLLFYLQALCYPFLGPQEMAARLPNLFASLVTVALTGRAATLLFRDQVGGVIAAGVVALSPLAVAFGATAFTDPLTVMWCTAALLAAVGRRPGYAGLWLGLGLATKYQAAFFVPLAAAALAIHGAGRRDWVRWTAGVACPAAAVLLWDLARAGRFELLSTQWRSYGGLSLVWGEALWFRLREWWRLGRYVTGSAGLNAVLIGALVVLVVRRSSGPPACGGRQAQTGRRSDFLAWLAIWLAGYALAHWLLEVQVWDRYLLPAVPIVALLSAGIVARLRSWRMAGWVPALALATMLVLMLPAAGQAAAGRLPVGGDHGLYDGIDQVAGFFSRHPYGTVLYDHWLSWELRYYMFDSRVHISWFASPAALVDDLEVFGRMSKRYLVVPLWESTDSARRAVEQAGFMLKPVLTARRPDETESFVVYQIVER